MSLIDYSKWDKLEVSSSEDEVELPQNPRRQKIGCCNCFRCCNNARFRHLNRPEDQLSHTRKDDGENQPAPVRVRTAPVEKKRPATKQHSPAPSGSASVSKSVSSGARPKDGDGASASDRVVLGNLAADSRRKESGKKKKMTSPRLTNNNYVPNYPTPSKVNKKILETAVPSFVGTLDTYAFGTSGFTRQPEKRMTYFAVLCDMHGSKVGPHPIGDECSIRVAQRDCRAAPATGLTRPHTVPKFVKVHPLDNLSTVHPVFYNDPDEFVPLGPDPSTGHFEIWGLHHLSWFADEKILNRRKNVQHNYSKDWFKYCQSGDDTALKYTGLPEVQFVQRLIEKKSEQLSARSRVFLERDYLLKVSLTGIRPEIFRRFKVSGGVSLHTLQDKILAPIMGWLRDYHCYCFVDQRDGAVYGPDSSSSTDSMFAFINGYKFYDDKKVQLGLVLQKRGDKLLFLYDLGDQWEHMISVEDVLSEVLSDGACRVTEAAMNCPVEDSRGLDGTGNPYYQEFLDLLPKKKKWRGPYGANLPSWAKVRLREMAAAGLNVTKPIFDPFECNLEDVQMRLKQVLSHSVRDMSESKGKEKDSGLALCCGCGNPNNLHLCSGCRMTYYCCRGCQREHWSGGHRRKCPKLALQHSEMKAANIYK